MFKLIVSGHNYLPHPINKNIYIYTCRGPGGSMSYCR